MVAQTAAFGFRRPHRTENRAAALIQPELIQHRLIHKVVDQERIVNLGCSSKPGERLNGVHQSGSELGDACGAHVTLRFALQ
jgi:hypothetical protein